MKKELNKTRKTLKKQYNLNHQSKKYRKKHQINQNLKLRNINKLETKMYIGYTLEIKQVEVIGIRHLVMNGCDK